MSVEGDKYSLIRKRRRSSLQSHPETLAEIISAIGAVHFEAAASTALCRLIGFEISAAIMHRPNTQPTVMYDNFDCYNGRAGLQNYVSFTHQHNPMLRNGAGLKQGQPQGVLRACDYMVQLQENDFIVLSAKEELGYRTVGWPEKLEEISLFLDIGQGCLELGFYRQRMAKKLPEKQLHALKSLHAPIAAAFERHAELMQSHASKYERHLPNQRLLSSQMLSSQALTTRESEIADLMLLGCSSEAIALRLCISRHTVKDHRKSIFKKLNIGSLAELFAVRL